jgi:hypothetical protein
MLCVDNTLYGLDLILLYGHDMSCPYKNYKLYINGDGCDILRPYTWGWTQHAAPAGVWGMVA